MRSIDQRSFLCGAAIVLAWPGLSLAQSAAAAQEAQGGGALEDIVVTATRSETSLQQTPVAITAFSAQALTQQGVKTLQDVATFTPGLSIGGRAGTGGVGGSMAIRGMGVDAIDSSASVGTYIDDVYFGSARGNILGLLDVQRIEVLRGPQGTLFGRNTIAGAIQYVTANPSNKFEGYVKGAVGNLKRTDIEGAINLPVTDTLALRVAAKYNDRDGYVHDLTTGQNRGADKSWGARVKLRWTPTDRLTIDLKGDYLREKTNGHAALVDTVNPNAQFVALAAAFGETRPFDASLLSTNFKPGHYESAGFNAPDYFHFRAKIVQGVVQYDLTDDLTVKSITAKSWYKSVLAADSDQTPRAIVAVAPANDKTRVFTQEVQLIGHAFDNALSYTTGVYYFDSLQKQNPGLGVVLGFLPVSYPYGNPVQGQKAIAGYAQGSYKLTNTLTATAGLRYSHERVTGYLLGVTLPSKATYTDWSPHLGLDWQVTDDVMVYAKASKGFRAGGVTPALALIGPTYPSGNRPFDPETAWTYEVGARMEFFDRRLRINPTLFLTDWKNIQFNAIDVIANTPVPVTKNAGNARIKGFELESQFAATDRLTLSGSLALLDSHYTQVEALTHTTFPTGWTILAGPPFVVPNSVVIVPDLTLDNTLPQAPKVKYTLGARYVLPFADGSRLTANVNYSWTDKQRSAVMLTGGVDMPSYGLVNARLDYAFPGDRLNFSVYGRNIGNTYYLVGAQDYAAGYTAGARELNPGIPREYGLEVQVKF